MLLRNLQGIFICLCFKILSIACEEGSTLVFAIDDTPSMRGDIKQVKKEAKAIMSVVLAEKSNQIKDFMLVTINDPESEVVLRTKTNSSAIFIQEVDLIHVRNYKNRDCEEMSLTGIQLSLLNSRPNSYIYVFTDASAKDYKKVGIIKTLCQRKQSQVVFVLTGDCGYPSSRLYTVFYEIAATCGGQVFPVKKDQVGDILGTIKILLRGKNSATKWAMIPQSFHFVPVPFTIDEKTDYAIVSTSGMGVYLTISTINHLYGPKPQIERITWIENSKVVRLIDPRPGTYYAWVKGDSAVSVVIYAHTDFTFEHGFSVLLPKSRKDTSKQPIAGARQYLTINVTDPEHSVYIKRAQILNLYNENHVIMDLPLRKIDDNIYVTNPFVSPTNTFRIAVIGETKKTHRPIKRLSTTAIEPYVPIVVVPESVPIVKIDNDNEDIKYGSPLTLTCRVRGHPTPKIVWYTFNNVLLPSKSALVEDTTYVSYLNLDNIKRSETYTCKAINKQGVDQKEVRVNVLPIFTPVSVPAANTPAKYNKDTTILCNITSHLPITIRWYKLEQELKNSLEYSISPYGSELTLKSTNFGMDGPYTCEATLNSDPTVKQSYTTRVTLTGLEHPDIEPSNNKINIKKNGKLELKCKIIKGEPQPRVRWFKKYDNQFDSLPDVTGEILSVPEATFYHAGQYKCIVDNVKGYVSAEFDVTVSSLPEITIGESERIFPYGSNAVFSCKVESQPPVTIQWMDNMGTKLQNKITQISKYEFENELYLRNVKKDGTYICAANNNEGATTQQVAISVPSPFKIKEHIEGDLGIQYGSEKILRCDIKSTVLMKIQWYRQIANVKSTNSQIYSNDKYTISDDGMDLKIKFMDSDMDGKYTCEASLLSEPEEKIHFNVKINTVGLSGPEIINSTTILDKKKFTAICRVKGTPMPTISWKFQPKGSKEFIAVPGSGEELNIPEIKLKHSGIYKCFVKNRFGEINRELNLVVKEAPEITFDKTFYYGVEGDLSLKIPCNVTGFPEPIVVWRKDNLALNIKKDDPKYAIKGNSLIIKNPVISDSANFTCVASNELGIKGLTAYTIITDEFQNENNFYGDTHNIYALQETTVNIRCNVANSDGRTVRWYKNGIKANETGNVYIIEKASVYDDGNYTCRVNTDEGTKAENYLLDVGYAPTFDDNGPTLKDVSWVEEENLNCEFRSKPEADVVWFHNGIKMESQTSPLHDLIDWGEYICNVTNVHESIQRTFRVTSPGCYLSKDMGTQNKPLISNVDKPTWPFLLSNSDILLKESEEIKFSCPSDKKSTNVFQTIPSKEEIIATCNKHDNFTVDGKTYRYSELQCKTKIEAIVQNNHEQCSGPDSEMIQVGFGVEKFMEIYKICFDMKLKVPLFGTALNIAKINNGPKPSEFKWSPALGLDDGKPTAGYTCKSGNCCYAKEQFLSYKEQPFGPAQVAMFKENLNSISVWTPCDESDRTSWSEFEKYLRDLSTTYETWFSWTGASDYAFKNGGLIPRYLWKVITYDGESSVMVYVNDKSPVPNDIRCKEACESMMTSSDKYLYCCTVEEFTKAFGIPGDKLITSH